MNKLKVRAGALQFTMFVVVVIALLLAAFIILLHTHKQFKIQTNLVMDVVGTSHTGIQYAMQKDIPLRDTIIVLQDEDLQKSLKVHKDYWGIFEKVVAVSEVKHKRFKKVALLGVKMPELGRTALYVADHNRPLVLVGNTKIEGLSYLPKQGVRTGNISGHAYYGTSLIYGITKTSTPELPKIDEKLKQYLNDKKYNAQTIDANNFVDITKVDNLKNSFLNPVKVVYSSSDIQLIHKTLVGHLIIQSETKIVVDASSQLKDVILIAPIIELRDNVKGTFQVLASKEITIGSQCELEYPSAIMLQEDPRNVLENLNTTKTNRNAKETPFIKINSHTSIKGIVLYLGDTKNYNPQLTIDSNSIIYGDVYCTSNLELLGQVNGSVYTDSFVASQSGSKYQNHIYNGGINSLELPESYAGLQIKDTPKNIVKWLY